GGGAGAAPGQHHRRHAVAAAVVQNVQAADVTQAGQGGADPRFVIEIGGGVHRQGVGGGGEGGTALVGRVVVKEAFAKDCHGTIPRCGYTDYSSPSCNRAASVMRSGVHGGSHTTCTFTSVTSDRPRTLRSTSGGSEPAAGHAGEVSVMRIVTA